MRSKMAIWSFSLVVIAGSFVLSGCGGSVDTAAPAPFQEKDQSEAEASDKYMQEQSKKKGS